MAVKRADGRWQGSFFVEGKRYYVYAKTKGELNEKLVQKINDIKSIKEKHDNPTLDQYNEIYTKTKRAKVKESTLRNYRYWYEDASNIILNCGIRLGDLRIKEIKPSDIREVQQSLISKGQSARTVNGVMSHLSDVFKMAVRDETIIKNPCIIIEEVKRGDKMQARETIHRALTVEETQNFFEAAKDSYYYNVFRIMLQTGLRIGEVGALYASDMDIKNNCLKITKTVTRDELGNYIIGNTTKTSTSMRNIPLNDSIKQIIYDQKELNKKLFGLRFNGTLFSSIEGKMLKETPVNRELKRICGKIQIEPITCHAFRATFSTRFIEQRPQDYKALSEILGHADTKITLDLYTHVMKETKEKAMDSLQIVM